MRGFNFEANQPTNAGRNGAANTATPLTTNERMTFAMADTVQSQNPVQIKVTQEFLRSIMTYDPLTGIFRWKHRSDCGPIWNSQFAGQVAGMVNDKGRIHIGITIGGVSKKLYAHRLAFIYMTGSCPAQVDHRDGKTANNSWDNLRPATQTQNMQNRVIHANNTSGFKGVSWDRASGKWLAQIRVNNRNKHLGRFGSALEAHAAYCLAADKYHREFACYGTRSLQPST